MTFLIERWNRRFGRDPQAVQIPEPAIESLLQNQELDREEDLVPDPEWDQIAQKRSRYWQRPVLFVIAALLLLSAVGYTLANDWWLARQHKNLDRQIGSTAATVKAEAVETKAQLQEGFEQLLQAETARPALVLPPTPPTPPAKFSQLPPPEVIRRLPPLPSFNAPTVRSLPPQPGIISKVQPQPKVILVGGNEQVVLLDVNGERVQLVPGQTNPHNITVISARNEPGRYGVKLRLANGSPLYLNLTTTISNPNTEVAEAGSQEAPVPAPPVKNEQITPLY